MKTRCSGQIGSMLELLQGKLSQQVMGVVTDRERGLFPKPGEIGFDCSCLDWASMCKHVAAVLYGVGSRLDDLPESLFLLRGVDTAELIATEMALPGDAATDDALADDALAGIFGIDLDTDIDTGIGSGGAPPPAPKAPAKPRKQARRRAAPASERQAPPVVKARDLPVSTAPSGRQRKAASGTGRGKKASPTAASRKRAAAPPRDIRPTGKWVARLRRRSGLSVAPVRRTAWRIASDRVPLGSDPRAAQPALPPAERPDDLVQAVRKAGVTDAAFASGAFPGGASPARFGFRRPGP